MHGVVMAAIRWQLVYATHDQLPFLAMRLNARAEHLVSDEMGNFMGHCLAQKVVGILPVQLFVETQQILLKVGHAGLLPTQLQAYFRAGEAALEKLLGQRVAGFDTGI